MGAVCFSCPRCGYTECGDNVRDTCPGCGMGPKDRKNYLANVALHGYVCRGCGFTTDYKFDSCPRCGDLNAAPLMPPELSHEWIGHVLLCKNTEKKTVMPPEVAMEIPYCPYCMEPLVDRPPYVAPESTIVSIGLRLPIGRTTRA